MNKQITLNEVKEKLNHNRSISSQANLLKYIALFLDQMSVAAQLTKNILTSLDNARNKGVAITEVIVAQAVVKELNDLIKETNFWKPLDFNTKIQLTQQLLAMSKFNAVLQKALTKQVNIETYIDSRKYAELTNEVLDDIVVEPKVVEPKVKQKKKKSETIELTEEETKGLTKGQIWNLKMQKVKERKRLELEQEVETNIETREDTKELHKDKNTNVPSDDVYDNLSQHMTPAEIEALKELQNTVWG